MSNAAFRNLSIDSLTVLSPTEIRELGLTDEQVVQRALRPRRVAKIAREWDPTAVGIVTVSERDNGDLILLDGQHRKAAALLRRSKDEAVTATFTCRVLSGLSRQEEAELFLKLNNTAHPTRLDTFLVGITAGDPVAVDIAAMVERQGYAISTAPGPQYIAAVKALEDLYTESERVEAKPNLVEAVLMVIKDAWGHDNDATKGALLQGIGWFLAEYGERVPLDKLARILASYPGGARAFFANAQSNAKVRGVRVHIGVADMLVGRWNNFSRKDKLETWTRLK